MLSSQYKPETEEQRLLLTLAEDILLPLWEHYWKGKEGIKAKETAKEGIRVLRALVALQKPQQTEDLSKPQSDALELLQMLSGAPRYEDGLPEGILERIDGRTVRALKKKGYVRRTQSGTYKVGGERKTG